MKIPGLTNRHRILLYAVTAVICLAAAASQYEIRSDQFGPLARAYIESLVDRRIEVGDASFTFWGRVTLRDVRILNPPGSASPYLVEIPRLRFYLGMTGGETSAFRPTSISIEDAAFSFERPDTGLWNTDRIFVAKPPRHDHPTFTLPITISNADVFYRDSQVGRSGIALHLEDVDANFTVMSDGSEIKNFLQTEPVALAGGGDILLALRSHPNARQVSATLQLRGADIRSLRPYYDFLSFLEFRSGRGTGTYRLDFVGDTWAGQAGIDVTEADIHHAASGTDFKGAAPRVAFRVEGDSERITLKELNVQWYRAAITGRGFFATRRATRPEADVTLTTSQARAEDLAFLLCDPAFRPTGTLSGTCRLLTPPGGVSRYEFAIDLTPSAIRYGEIFQKPAGVRGRLEIAGRFGGKPEKLAFVVAETRGELVPEGSTWILNLPRARGEDLRNHLTSLADQPEVSLSGTVAARLRLGGSGAVSGTVDLTDAALALGDAAVKPVGMVAKATVEAQLRPDGWRITDGDLQVRSSRLHVAGTWTSELALWTATVAQLYADDLFAVLPQAAARVSSTVMWSGPLQGRLDWKRRGRAGGEFTANVDLTPVALVITGAGRKPAGIAGDLRLTGAVDNGVLRVAESRLRLQSTTLTATGELGGGGVSLTLRGRSTGLDGLKNFLADSFWSGLGQLETSGNGDVEITVQGRGGMTTIRADLVATWARLSYGDTWFKPAGESLRAHALIVQMPELTRVERLEIVQGASSLVAAGTISAGRPAALDATVTAQIDIPRFIAHAPGLSRVVIERRNAAEALQLIADADDRATLNWKATGTLEEPRLDLAMREIVGRAVINTIARQVRRFASIITAPVTFGFEIIRPRPERSDSESATGTPSRPAPPSRSGSR